MTDSEKLDAVIDLFVAYIETRADANVYDDSIIAELRKIQYGEQED